MVWLLLLFSLAIATETEIDPVLYDHEACTAILVGKQATTEGSTLTTHTNDCKNCDFRLARVPARDHLPYSQRPVAPVRFDYPRFVGEDRGEVFLEEKVDKTIYPWRRTEAIGYIPQVAHTYSYLDGVYAIQNEKGLSFGESTCGGRLVNFPVHDGGHALFDLTELTRIAMERCDTARCAIKLMGNLSVEHGFYGTVWTGGLIANFEAGETLTVADGKETWVFHVSPDGTNKSAVWIAQRVPDGHVSVVANMFVIRTFNLSDSENFMGSDNIYSVAKNAGLWNESMEPLDFVLTYGFPIPPGADLYFYRRVWRVFDFIAPSLQLDPNLRYTPGGGGYPFSVKPDRLLTVRDIMFLNRDHFEGTEFDLTKGIGGGPYGNPNRYDKGASPDVSKEDLRLGHYERPISMFRTSYSTVVQARQFLPPLVGARLWFGTAQPHSTVYLPIYPGTIHEPIPSFLSTGSLYKFTRDALFWCVTFITGWAEKMYLPMLPDIQQAQIESEELAMAYADHVEAQAFQLLLDGEELKAQALLAFFSTQHANATFHKWWALAEHLIAKFHDGFRLDDFHAMTIEPVLTAVWYPRAWLAASGYWPNGDPHPALSNLSHTTPLSSSPSNPYRSSNPDIAGVEGSPNHNSTTPTVAAAFPVASGVPFGTILVSLFVGLYLGYILRQKMEKYDQGYVAIGDS